MTQEEKAKAYDEAIERAKSKIKNDKDHILYEDDVIEIFPELCESEDERIRKYIIWHLKHTITYPDNSINNNVEEAIAWLEKQVEQKPTDNYCQENCKGYRDTGGKCFADGECEAKKKAEQNYILSKEDEKNIEMINSAIDFASNQNLPRRIINDGDKYMLKDWLKSLKPRLKYQWTDEDEKNLNDLLVHGETKLGLRRWIAELPEKLGSRYEYHWKPSEEQLTALKNAIIGKRGPLYDLYFDLEKL